jgi:5'-AMP-activated protein kinase regulatory beta subunit
LPKGIYYYKFIVDGEWKFSPDDPHTPDENGNINNYIDTTQMERSVFVEELEKNREFETNAVGRNQEGHKYRF